jgi:hypothetical protein
VGDESLPPGERSVCTADAEGERRFDLIWRVGAGLPAQAIPKQGGYRGHILRQGAPERHHHRSSFL